MDNGGYISTVFLCHKQGLLFCNGKKEDEVAVWDLNECLEECKEMVVHKNKIILEKQKDSIKSAELLSETNKNKSNKSKNKNRIVKVSFRMLNENAEKMNKETTENNKNFKRLYYEKIKENQYFKNKINNYKDEIKKLREYNRELLDKLKKLEK